MGKRAYTPAPWHARKYGVRKHERMEPDDSGPSQGLPKRMNEQTERPEYLCRCFHIWYDPEDMEKTVSNVKAHFFNKRKANWDKGKGAGPPDHEENGKGPRWQEECGNYGWAANRKEARGTKKERVPTRRKNGETKAGERNRKRVRGTPKRWKSKERGPAQRTSWEIRVGKPNIGTPRQPNKRKPT